MKYPKFPEPIGIFRAIQKPTYNEMLDKQMEEAKESVTKSLKEIINGEENWTVV
jgi:2-oxoglutarate ferredoxin oxidoreductase subunit beta